MQIVYRKIITASIAGTIYSILLALFFPTPFGQSSSSRYLLDVISTTPTYMMYVFAVVYTYGILSSIVSDKIANLLANKSGDHRLAIMVSGSLHIVFGLVLLLYSLVGAIVFFLIDRILLQANKHYTWVVAITSLLIPLLALFIFIHLN